MPRTLPNLAYPELGSPRNRICIPKTEFCIPTTQNYQRCAIMLMVFYLLYYCCVCYIAVLYDCSICDGSPPVRSTYARLSMHDSDRATPPPHLPSLPPLLLGPRGGSGLTVKKPRVQQILGLGPTLFASLLPSFSPLLRCSFFPSFRSFSPFPHLLLSSLHSRLAGIPRPTILLHFLILFRSCSFFNATSSCWRSVVFGS